MSEKIYAGVKSNVSLSGRFIKKSFLSDNDSSSEHLISDIKSDPYPQIYYFRKEVNFLNALQRTYAEGGKVFTPLAYDGTECVRDNKGRYNKLEIIMDYIPGSTYMDLIKQADSKEQIFKILKEATHQIIDFHHYLKKHQDKLIREVSWGRNIPTQGIKFRSADKEREKLWHYLRAIIYFESSEFRERFSYERTSIGSINNAVKDYLYSKNIDSIKFTKEFIDRKRRILYNRSYGGKIPLDKLLREGTIGIVNGDLGPQHIFEDGRFIDFDEVRLDLGEVDLVSTLYNTHLGLLNTKDESKLRDIALEYLDGMGKSDTLGEERFFTRITQLRLEDRIRLFGISCKYMPEQIQKFTSGNQEYENLNDEEFKRKYLDNVFIKELQKFLDFYSRGEGLHQLENSTRKLMVEQLNNIEYFFNLTKVF